MVKRCPPGSGPGPAWCCTNPQHYPQRDINRKGHCKTAPGFKPVAAAAEPASSSGFAGPPAGDDDADRPCSEDGIGAPQDDTEAARWCRIAADQGLARGDDP